MTIPVYTDKLVQPTWTMDKQNGSISVGFFTNAGIPSTAYGGSSSSNWPLPAELDCCDQIFVMPHADPTWATHQRLFTWNDECEGAIWLACHAGSALENMFNPANPSQQTNFLAMKNQVASGGGPYFQNALLLWGNHDDGTLPYSYDHHGEPEMQFLGTIDAATQNGSEQIYIPLSEGWWPNTKVGVYDPDHPERYTPYDEAKHRAAVLAFGPGMGDPDRGDIMLEASHNISGTAPANVAAQRAFFNFSLHTLAQRAVFPSLVLPSSNLNSGVPYVLDFTLPAGVNPAEYTANWSSSCGGTFTPIPGSPLSVTFTPPVALTPQNCLLTVSIANACNHTSFTSEVRTIQCNLQVTPTITNPCFSPANSGSIAMAISNGPGPYVWNWTRSGGGSGSGSGTTIMGLSAGTYNVTVTANNGAGCPASFQVTLTALPQIVVNTTVSAVKCFGGSTGSISTSVSGGVPPFTYLWNGGQTTANRSGLSVGTYTVTVTDSKGCTAVKVSTVTQPALLTVSAATTNVNCFNAHDGTITLTLGGGSAPYTFLWNDGNTSQNRTGVSPGTYAVTVTDANQCTASVGGLTITQPAAALAVSGTATMVSCHNEDDGTITLTVSGGTPGYTYDWDKIGEPAFNSTQQSPTALTAGVYSVTVTDTKSCKASLSIEVDQPEVINPTVVVTPPTCPPGADPPLNADGAINLSVTGGNPPFTYAWTASGGGVLPAGEEDDEDPTGLTAGTYTLMLTDSEGCTASLTVNLTNLNPSPSAPNGITHN